MPRYGSEEFQGLPQFQTYNPGSQNLNTLALLKQARQDQLDNSLSEEIHKQNDASNTFSDAIGNSVSNYQAGKKSAQDYRTNEQKAADSTREAQQKYEAGQLSSEEEHSKFGQQQKEQEWSNQPSEKNPALSRWQQAKLDDENDKELNRRKQTAILDATVSEGRIKNQTSKASLGSLPYYNADTPEKVAAVDQSLAKQGYTPSEIDQAKGEAAKNTTSKSEKNSEQMQAASAASEAQSAESAMQSIEASGYKANDIDKIHRREPEKVPFVGPALSAITPDSMIRTKEDKSYDNAARQWATAAVRAERKDKFTEQAVDEYVKQYTPQPGDPEEEVNRKRAARAQKVRDLQAISGTKGSQFFDNAPTAVAGSKRGASGGWGTANAAPGPVQRKDIKDMSADELHKELGQ